MKYNIGVVTNIPAPYRIQFFDTLSKLGEMDFKFFFCSSSEHNRQWIFNKNQMFKYQFVPGIKIKKRDGSMFHINPTLFFNFCKFKPDIIISVGASLPTVISFIYSFLFRIPLIIWWAGTKETEKNINKFKEKFRKWFFCKVNGFITYGTMAKDYLIDLGCEENKIYIVGNMTFDAYKYNKSVSSLRFRKNDSKIIIIGVGQLIERKNYLLLVDVFRKAVRKFRNLELIIVGSGSEERKLKDFCKVNTLDGSVKITGFVKYDEIPKFYAMADIFVHPTLLDHWSQAVNEAMSAGLPVIVSNKDGAVKDLIEDEKNGYVFDIKFEDELLEKLIKLIQKPALREEMGNNALGTAIRHDINYSISVFKNVIKLFCRR